MTDLEGKSFRQKVSSGAYTYQAVSRRILHRFQLNQKKVGYLEELINNKDITDDERFVVKKVHMQVLKYYNQYRWTFILLATMICVSTAANPKRSMPLRLMPTLIVGPFLSLYTHHVGNYGVHRNIDACFKTLLTDPESRLGQ